MRDPVIDSLRAVAGDALRPSLDGGQACALVSYPNHGNPGDSAIWLGTKRWLQESGKDVLYEASPGFYSPDFLRVQCPEGPIYIHGGGNFGDLWDAEQHLRERVLRDFPDRPVIQLPQTVFYRDPANARAVGGCIRAHPSFTCYVRDACSKKRYEDLFDREAILCPDMAVFYEGGRRSEITVPVVELFRGDKESAFQNHRKDSWIRHRAFPEAAFFFEAERIFQKWRVAPPAIFLAAMARRHDAISQRRVTMAERLLSGRVVITDRLHAHILCMLLGIPHVVVDNVYGKVTSFIQEWTKGSPLVHLADTPEKARVLAQELL